SSVLTSVVGTYGVLGWRRGRRPAAACVRWFAKCRLRPDSALFSGVRRRPLPSAVKEPGVAHPLELEELVEHFTLYPDETRLLRYKVPTAAHTRTTRRGLQTRHTQIRRVTSLVSSGPVVRDGCRTSEGAGTHVRLGSCCRTVPP